MRLPPVLFHDEVDSESFVDSVLEAREQAVSGKEHYDVDKPETRGMISAIVCGIFFTRFGERLYNDLREQAAALSARIATEHPFSDGNKRTALLIVDAVITRWGRGAGLSDSIDSDEFFDIIQAVAQRHMSEAQYAEWLKKNTRP